MTWRCRCGFEGVELWFLNLRGPGFSFWCRGCQLGISALPPLAEQMQRTATPEEKGAATKIGCTPEVYVFNVDRRRLHCTNCRKWKARHKFPLQGGAGINREGRGYTCRFCLSIAHRPRVITFHQGI